jgi:hypothetical protein
MISKEVIGVLSLVLAFVSYAPYVRSIFVANTRPHAFSWIVWGAVSAIAFVAQLTEGAGAGGWVTGFSAAACLGIGMIAIFRGEKNITRGDWLSFATTLLAIPLWMMTDDPLWSVLLVTGIDAVAYYPTFRKSYSKPDEELAFKYVLTAVKHLLSLFALENVTMVTAVYPFVSLFMEAGVVALLLWRRTAKAAA